MSLCRCIPTLSDKKRDVPLLIRITKAYLLDEGAAGLRMLVIGPAGLGGGAVGVCVPGCLVECIVCLR